MSTPSTAASAQYDVACPVCFAKPKEPCRTRKTLRVTDTHQRRIDAAYPDWPATRVGEWGSD